MKPQRREIVVFTPGKQYSGEVDIPNVDFRTTDLLNSTNLFWKDPADKNFDDVLLMFNVTLSIDGIREFQKFARVQIRLPNIIFFHDNLTTLGNAEEKKRAEALKAKTREEKKAIHLITQVRFNSFFEIKGSFYGLFKSKSIQRYLPLSDVVMHEMIKQPDSWKKKKIHLSNNFLGVNTKYIESCVFD
ncbi:MAG: hypothetical protein K9K37_09250 [Desulfocapsa sp.]|nr:hypothetical protein [Desulfocapsa sp.]